jgi:insulin-like growth factor 2 mRNA-binding protein 1
MIKKIRDASSTKITVSNSQEMAALYPDRVIAIRGSVDGMSQAEAAISAKLAECMEQEMQQAGPMLMPLGIGASYFPNSRAPYDAGPNLYTPMYAPVGGRQSMGSPSVGLGGGGGPGPGSYELCQLAVPNSAVGAIIGTAGSNIKQMMRESGAFVNIEPRKEGDPSAERLVTIKGSVDSCWNASFLVFEKMKLEGFGGNDDVRLMVIIRIPKPMVGRVIGKGGKNVRELQRVSGAMIKLPEDPSVQGDEVAVELYGNFVNTQTAHARIRLLANQTYQPNYANGGPPVGQARGAGPRRGPAHLAQQTAEA